MKEAARSQKSRERTNRLSRFNNSGLGVGEFCREERVSVVKFYLLEATPARHVVTQGRIPPAGLRPRLNLFRRFRGSIALSSPFLTPH
ncbi:MAG: hypothetical protein KatS3mg110_1652 [Pirellulaceae bacterium]|nr:MAG: hypothetical protein KatS3mg110_1652 [Pirellulaceae bacterium]